MTTLTLATIAPMNFDSADLADLDLYINDDRYSFEQKLDGARCMVRMTDGHEPEFLTRGGRPLNHSASAVHFASLRKELNDLELPGEWVFDGELLCDTGVLWLFDMAWAPGAGSLCSVPYAARRKNLDVLLGDERVGRIRVSPQAVGAAAKRDLSDRIYANGGEGVMMKRLDAGYDCNKRVKHSLKAKFVSTADVVIGARNVNGKMNAEFHVFGGTDGRTLIQCGGCSMIGKPDAQVGDVVEVRYLYATDDGILYQPTLLRIRTPDEKRPDECTTDQFRFVNKEVVDGGPAAPEPEKVRRTMPKPAPSVARPVLSHSNATIVFHLIYEGSDSPRGKCYFAAYDGNGNGCVAWGAGLDSASQIKVEASAKVVKKLDEKRGKGYVQQNSYETDLEPEAAIRTHLS